MKGLVRDGALVADEFVDISNLAREEALPATGALLVSLEQWQARREVLVGRRLGIRLASDQSPQLLGDDLRHFSLVALEFPRFRDGRAYSHARILRERLGFAGEIRAVGDVLLEQLHFMQRCGFNAFDIDSTDPLHDWQLAQGEFSSWYQATGDGRQPARVLRHGG
ncbi:MAG: DUF934 domain-containing protein [Chromatiales bacterium]|nr:DUF934 domain-containing protein [Chromatiales bacterium]